VTELSVLLKGLNFAKAPKKIPIQRFVVEVESSIYGLTEIQKSDVRNKVTSIVSCAKPPSSNLSKAEEKAITNLRKDKNYLSVLKLA